MLVIGPSVSGKTNALIDLIQKQDNGAPIDRIYLYAKGLSEQNISFRLKNVKIQE